MSRARRQPPLFEFLGGPDRRPLPVPPGQPAPAAGAPASNASTSGQHAARVDTPTAPPPPPLRRPVEVSIPSNAQAARVRTKPAQSRNWVFWGALAAAGLIVVLTLLFNLGYWFGRKDEQATLKPYISDKQGASDTGSGTNPPVASPVPVRQLPPTDAPQPSPSTPQPFPSGTTQAQAPDKPTSPPDPQPVASLGSPDPRKPGTNYLELCTLTYKDARQAVEYLGANGLRAASAPAQRGVDPAKAAANNAPHVVFLADGVPSDRFRATEKERAKLAERVEQVGKKFQKDLRGATDFSRPMWRLFREKDAN